MPKTTTSWKNLPSDQLARNYAHAMSLKHPESPLVWGVAFDAFKAGLDAAILPTCEPTLEMIKQVEELMHQRYTTKKIATSLGMDHALVLKIKTILRNINDVPLA